MENGLERICDAIDYVLMGNAKSVGGIVIGNTAIVVTVNNGHYADAQERAEIARLLGLERVDSFPGGIAITSQPVGRCESARYAPPPHINPRLVLTAN